MLFIFCFHMYFVILVLKKKPILTIEYNFSQFQPMFALYDEGARYKCKL